MQYGINLLLWTDVLTDAAFPILDEIKAIGYDAVELPIFEFDVPKYAAWGKRLDKVGLARTAVTVRGADDNPISADPAVRAKGVANNKKALDCAQAAGCSVLAGPMHSGLGVFSGAGPTKDEWKWGVESMRQVAEYADVCGGTLALEALNRFECYFINTTADLARFCRDVNHPRCRAMYDSFHSHIEEKNTPRAIQALKGQLAHVHISENDRSTPGSGNVHWDETFETLTEVGYDGLLVIEAFGLLLEKLVPAVKIWRRMYDTEKLLISDGLRFMKEQTKKHARKQ
ncbi:MAG: sugar phosphate isomerase/epimerase [Candidatus Sumerlaeota bacterium]|nr:sugar phosphate isomerase/epimerase [Candidatus Sumerlaeota bacterium]